METSTVSAEAQRLTVEEDAVASQVLEIIGGITTEALRSLEEPEDRDVWSVEEGDDSVFYSDEDQAHQDIHTNSADELNPKREDEPGEESVTDKENSDTEKEETQQVVLTEKAEEDLQTPKTECTDQSDAGAQSNPTAGESESACGASLQLNCTITETQTQAEPNTSSEEANLPAEEEEVTPSLEHFDVTNEESYARLSGEAGVPEQMSAAEPQMSADRQLQVNQDAGRERSLHVPVGFHQNPGPGYSATLPLPKKSAHRAGRQNSFDHLASSAYSTVSYRKIRRGNTRQKIEEFEYMIMNL